MIGGREPKRTAFFLFPFDFESGSITLKVAANVNINREYVHTLENNINYHTATLKESR